VFHDIHEDEIELALFTNNLFKSTFGKSWAKSLLKKASKKV
jgi:hypothetical protein